MKRLKSLSTILLSILMLSLVGCGNSRTTPDNSNTTKAMTTAEYNTYLTERYNYYFNDLDLYNDYDVYQTGFDYNGTYDEFITSYNNSYADLKTNLKAFKNDLETNVAKGTPEVDKLNQDVITSIDQSIIATDDYTSGFATKAKEYATYSKDEVIKGLQSIGRVPNDARLELHRLVNDAKNSLGL